MHVIVHAGPPKTASTAIQTALRASAAALEHCGIALHWGGKPVEWALAARYAGLGRMAQVPRLMAVARDEAGLRAWSEREWQAMEARLARMGNGAGPDVLVISSEHFATMPDRAAFLARLSDDGRRRVSVIGYARDPVSHFVSRVDQRIRLGLVLADLPRLAQVPSALAGLRGFASHLPAQDLVVRNFHALTGGDAAVDFFQTLGALTGRSLPAPPPVPRVNESLPAAASLWLMTANGLAVPPRDRDRLVAGLRADPALAALPRLRLDDGALANTLRHRAQPLLAWLRAGILPESAFQGAAFRLPDPAPALEGEALALALRDWILAAGAAGGLEVVARAVLGLAPTTG